jgi:hypothetical protein
VLVRDVEAERQSALLAAVLAPRGVDQVAGFEDGAVLFSRGLGAYRVHARASAARALGNTFPTVLAMLGDDNFQALAQSYLMQHPQTQGDLGAWGQDLAAFIDAQADLQAWPYLADCARLDFAVHQCERAADAEFDAVSMVRLADTDPAQLRLEFMPGTALIVSDGPLRLIHQAHALPEGEPREALFAQVREVVAHPQTSAVLVSREGWRAVVSSLAAHEVGWTQHLMAGHSLGSALAQIDAAFDFNTWLTEAVTAGRLKGIQLLRD